MNGKQKSIAFHVFNSIAQGLTEVLTKEKHADRVIDKYFRINSKWTAYEKHFFAETFYEILRHKLFLEFLGQSENIWSIIGTYLVTNNIKLPNGRNEFSNLNIQQLQKNKLAPMPDPIRYSMPEWLNSRGQKDYLTDWPHLMKSLNKPPEIYLRTNTLKISRDQLSKELKKEGVETFPVKNDHYLLSEALQLKERKNVFSTQAYKSGFFEMQDAGSQVISTLLDVEAGQKVVDACAGSGGKTLHLASLMKNQGEILALDIQDQKLQNLQERGFKAGVKIIKTQKIESLQTIKRLENQFDRVLLDAPCSGLGVLRRNPDSKWKITPDQILELLQTQSKILNNYSLMCKAGGKMVYATCSLLNSENENQIDIFLNGKNGKNWSLIKQIKILPHIDGFDGFYAAVLKRN